MKQYEEVILNNNKDTEEVLVHIDGHKVIISTDSIGEYGFGKRVSLSVISEDFKTKLHRRIGYSKAKMSNSVNNITERVCKDSIVDGCLCTELKTFEELKQIGIEYFVKLITELKK